MVASFDFNSVFPFHLSDRQCNLMFSPLLLSDGQCSGASFVSAEFIAQLIPRSTEIDPEAKRQVLRLRSLVKQDRQDQR